ncbi:hypothetical protein LguiA_015152 [Lonicera macranthoides]
MNKIDSCWRAKSNWAANRRALADCAVGFGKDAIGGKYGPTYVVTNPSDDPINPKQGTLRYGVIQTKPLWIVFSENMVIRLKNELIMNSYKTIDGRGVKVEIAVRLGYAHVANNRYDEWQMYAIGGSANPTILSEGNYFMAPKYQDHKQVTKREVKSGWKNWKWRSSKDKFVNGAYFVQSGWGSCAPLYSKSQSFVVADGSMVPALTSNAGPLPCAFNRPC